MCAICSSRRWCASSACAFRVVGDVDRLELGALGVVVERPEQRLHLDEVDDAAELVLRADGKVDDERHRVETLADHLYAALEVGTDAVHLVDEADARDVVLVGLAPYRLRLRFDTGDCVEHRDGTVENAQTPLDLDREVDVAGRVDDVDLAVVPLRSRGGRRDRDAALLLLDHVVHDGRALVDLADLVGAAGVVEDALGRRGLARVDVGHDPDVAGLLEGKFACHCVVLSLRGEGVAACAANDRARGPVGARARPARRQARAIALTPPSVL